MKNQLNRKIITVIALLSLGLLAACSKAVMKPERADVEKVMDAVIAAGKTMTAKEAEAAQSSDEGKKAALKKMFIDPVADEGFDVDKSLQSFATKFIEKDFTQEEGQILAGFLMLYTQSAADFERLGLVTPETAVLLKKVKI